MATPATAPKSMDSWLRRYATQATAALSAVVAISGVMMFFHLFKGEVEALHEWLGMAFVAVAVAHVVRHRHGFSAMLTQTRMRVLLGLAGVATAAFIVAAPPKGANSFRQSAQVVMQAPLKDLAPLVGVPADELATRLGATDVALSIDAIARAQGADPVKLMEAALARRQ